MPADTKRRSFSWSGALGATALAVLIVCCVLTVWLGSRHGLREETLATAANLRLAFTAAALALGFSLIPALAAALHVSEFLDGRRRQAGKGAIELLAAVPLLVWALLGWDHLVAGPSLAALSGFLLLVALPHLATLLDEALQTVPREARTTAQSLGATEWQTVGRVVLPAARVGLCRALTLTFARLLAESAVLLWIVQWSKQSTRLPGAGASPSTDVVALAAVLGALSLMTSVALQRLAGRSARGARS